MMERINNQPTHKSIYHSSISIAGYFRQHFFALKQSLKTIFGAPFASLLTLSVIAFAVALALFVWLFFVNLQALTQSWERAQISVYLKKTASRAEADHLVKLLQQNKDFSRVEYIPAEQGISDFERQTGLSNILATLGENPLPDVVIVYPAPALTLPAKIEALATHLQNYPEVDSVQLDRLWIQRLHTFSVIGTDIASGFAAILSVGILLIIVNAIRINSQSAQSTIQAIKLVGGSNYFIRRPFLYTGLFYSLAGSVIGVFLVNIIMEQLEGSIQQLAKLYHTHIIIQGVNPVLFAEVVAVCGVLGYLGAWLSMYWPLRKSNF